MRYYDQQYAFYCGVDLHTKRMYLCILDHEGNKRLHRNVRAKPRDRPQRKHPHKLVFHDLLASPCRLVNVPRYGSCRSTRGS